MKRVFENEKLKIVYHPGAAALPKEVLELRKETFVDERNIMVDSEVEQSSDTRGWHILIYDKECEKLVAAAHIEEASHSEITSEINLDDSQLHNAVFAKRATIAKDYRGRSVLPLLIYALMRPYQQHEYLLFYLHKTGLPVKRYTGAVELNSLIPKKIPSFEEEGMSLTPYISTTEKAMINCFRHVSNEYSDILGDMLMDDVETYTASCVEEFQELTFWKRAKAKTLSKYEYLNLLSDMHQYVRMTTRMLALAAGNTESAELRKYYIDHVQEEIDHEKILESDMSYLGGDAKFLLHDRPMSTCARLINSLGESLINTRRTTDLYLAIPLVLESMAGSLGKEQMSSLLNCIKSWGYDKPQNGASMLISHSGFDVSHMQKDLEMISAYVTTEKQKRELLVNMKITLQAVESMFNQAEISIFAKEDHREAVPEMPLGESVSPTTMEV